MLERTIEPFRRDQHTFLDEHGYKHVRDFDVDKGIVETLYDGDTLLGVYDKSIDSFVQYDDLGNIVSIFDTELGTYIHVENNEVHSSSASQEVTATYPPIHQDEVPTDTYTVITDDAPTDEYQATPVPPPAPKVNAVPGAQIVNPKKTQGGAEIVRKKTIRKKTKK